MFKKKTTNLTELIEKSWKLCDPSTIFKIIFLVLTTIRRSLTPTHTKQSKRGEFAIDYNAHMNTLSKTRSKQA